MNFSKGKIGHQWHLCENVQRPQQLSFEIKLGTGLFVHSKSISDAMIYQPIGRFIVLLSWAGDLPPVWKITNQSISCINNLQTAVLIGLSLGMWMKHFAFCKSCLNWSLMIYRLFSWQHILTTFVQALTLFCLDVNKKQKQNSNSNNNNNNPTITGKH